jgi:acetylglutamate kinase
LHSAVEKAATLVEALQWIRRFRDKITVVKLGGRLMDDPVMLRELLVDIHFMQTVGMRPVIVHGGGAQIDRALTAAQIEPRFAQGRRITDAATLAIVERVLAGELNQYLADMLEQVGGRAMTLNFESTPVLFGEPLRLAVGENPAVDLGFVGQVTRVDRLVIENLCYAGQVPIIPSMCLGVDGQRLNVNADTAATKVAQAVGAEKLVMLSDVPGVLADPRQPESVISTLTATQARRMLTDGSIQGGMIPKVEACLETIDHGVSKVHIIDGRLRHSLLLEIYTSQGIGTQIVED